MCQLRFSNDLSVSNHDERDSLRNGATLQISLRKSTKENIVLFSEYTVLSKDNFFIDDAWPKLCL